MLYNNMGYTAGLTPPEGLDSPIPYSSLSEESRRQRDIPANCCYAQHKHPHFPGISCSGPATQYWTTVSCRLCSPDSIMHKSNANLLDFNSDSDLSPLTAQSGVFPYCGYFESFPVVPDLLYDDGSVVLEAFESVRAFRDAYLKYYEVGDYTLPPPNTNWYQDAFSVARRVKKQKISPQSGNLSLPVIQENMEHSTQQVLTTFSDDTMHVEATYDRDLDNSFYNVDTDVVSLSKFLSRPVKIFSKQIIPAIISPVLFDFINPTLFFSNKRVINRMNNFKNFKCDLCFRFMVNGSPFHYGRWIAAAVPNTGNDVFITPTTITDISGIGILSQLPHVYISPTTDQGGCLRLPYLHHYNSFDLTKGEHLSTGTIVLGEMSPLKLLSATSADSVTLSVMCWAENVVFGAPTQTNIPGLLPQSGDEYGNGVISKPLSVLAQVAGALARIVAIRPYALASQQLLNLGANIAVSLGFSKPAIVSDMMYMVPRTIPNLSSATQHDPIYKLTYDDKQEVTHDPSVVGLARKDEMLIKSLIEKETYIGKFAWTGIRTPETTLINYVVTPSLHLPGSGVGSAQKLCLPPLAYIGQMFRLWRGSLRFRFVCVASSFHRGRLRITYDPNGLTPAQQTAGVEHNIAYTYIWDISENHEVVVDVGYMSHIPYCRVQRPGLTPIANMISPTPPTRDAAFDNGILNITVLNDLTANGALNTDIEILAFICAGPDFEYCDPTDGLDNFSLFPQSGELMEDDLMASTAVVPNITFGVYIPSSDKAPVVHHGDPVTSLRYILKRYCTYTTFPVIGLPANSTASINIVTSAFPFHRGKAPGGMHLAGGGSYNYCFNTPLAWCSAMFYARRGGVRWRLRDSSSGLTIPSVRVIRNSSSSTHVYLATPVTAGTSVSDAAKKSITALNTSGNSGMAVGTSIDGFKTHVDCEVPYLSPRRYFSPRLGDNSLNHNQGITITALATNNSTAPGKEGSLTAYISAADDFSLSGFVATPYVYYTPTLL